VTGVLESLHHELPVHKTSKRSGPSDLVQELAYRISGFGVRRVEILDSLAFRTPGYRNPDTARTVGSGEDSQPSISVKVRFQVLGFEESKDLTLGHR
jgi:hypothetical protein